MDNTKTTDSTKLDKFKKCYIKEVSLEEGLELGKELYNIISSRGYNDNYEKVLDLIFRGANLEYKTADKGYFSLLICARKNYLKTALALVKAGANVNQTNNYKTTATMAAARHGCVEILKLLIFMGADINMRCVDGDTAISSALIHNQKECFDILVKNQAILTNRSLNNKTILDIPSKIKIDNSLFEDDFSEYDSGVTSEDTLHLVEEAKKELEKIKNR